MDLGAWTEASWAAAGVWATVAVYLLLLVFVARQVGEARRLREQEARPYVVIQFEPGFIIHFVIENMGRTVARDVQISFEDWPVTTLDYAPWSKDSESALLRDGIPFLAPGNKMRFIFDSFPARAEAGLPLVYKATVTYRSFDGKRPYTDPYTLDLSLYSGVLEVQEKGLEDVATSLDKMRRAMDRWTDGHRGLRVSASSRYLDVSRDRRQWDITLAKRAYRQDGWKGLVTHCRENFVRRHGLSSLDD